MDDFENGEYEIYEVNERRLKDHPGWKSIPRWNEGLIEAVRFVRPNGWPIYPGYVQSRFICPELLDKIYRLHGCRKPEDDHGYH